MARSAPHPVRVLATAPITVPCIGALALLGWWAADGAGYSLDRWAPGALVVLALVGVALIVVPNAWGALPRDVLVATAALALFTGWSFASIAWAGDRGAALEGADRTLLYLALFCLFALWRQRSRTAATLVVLWTLTLTLLACVVVLELPSAAHPSDMFLDDRLAIPSTYPNATAAVFAMALWPALILAGSARIPAVLRGLSAGGAVLFVGLATLAQSRGALFAIPLTGLICFAAIPGRLRTGAVLVLVAAGVAICEPALFDVADALSPGARTADADRVIAHAGRLLIAVAFAVGVVVAAIAAWEQLRPPSERTRRLLTLVGRVAATLIVAGGAVGAIAATGNPVDRADAAWQSFKGGYGDNDQAASSRLVGGLGSNRYDFFRVALDEFTSAPLAGDGADNFQQAYLREGTSSETPRYPHSVELRTLSQTGLVGAVLLFAAIAAAAVAAWRGMRVKEADDVPDAAIRAAAGGAALMACAYVLVHGSVDWFFETAGLGGPAFALLGLAASLAPRDEGPEVRVGTVRAAATLGPAAVVLLAGAVAIAMPWTSGRELRRAGDVFDSRPLEAYDLLDRAASLDPLSDRPALLAGSIAVRYGDLARADAAFTQALERVPDGQYATLQRGAIASARGQTDTARQLLRRAVALAPRDALARASLKVVRSGGAVDVVNLNRRILEGAQEITSDTPPAKG